MFYDPRAPYPRAYFSASDLAAARYGEARFLWDQFVSVYAIACACNQQVCSGKILPELRLEDVPIKAAEKYVPSIRGYKLRRLGLKNREPKNELPLYQPCLVVDRGERGLELIDGVERLAAAKSAGAQTIRCFVIPYEKAIKFGRAIIDDSPVPSAVWRTLHGTMPPQMESQKQASGAALSAAHRGLLTQDEFEKHRYQSSLLAIAATAGATVEGRVVADINVRAVFNSDKIRLRADYQADLDVLFRANPDRFQKRGPAKSLYEIFTVLYIKRLIAVIGTLDGRAGKTVLAEAGVENWPGAPKDLVVWLKDRSQIKAYACPFFSGPIHVGLLQIGMRWQSAEPKGLVDHCVDLANSAFKVHELVELQRKNLRRLLEVNTPNARPRHRWPGLFNTAVDGALPASWAKRFALDCSERALLALHARINPAKIWRDDARNTLLYQWIIALGDLVRTGKMIVTCLMAQELFQVEDIRSVEANPEISPAWILFDRILPLATIGKICSLNPLSELNLLCRDAMRDRCTQIISLSNEIGRHFKAEKLETAELNTDGSPAGGKQTRVLSPSEIAELPILLT